MGAKRGLAVAGWVLGLLGVMSEVASPLYLRRNYGLITVAGEGMSPTYEPGDQVVYERGVDEVRRGDVVLYDLPGGYPEPIGVIRRVGGVGGNRVVCCRGDGAAERIVVDGRSLAEPYVRDGVGSGMFHESYDAVVPEGRLFVVGDHRTNSRDFREFLADRGGTVSESAVRGRVSDDRTGAALLAVPRRPGCCRRSRGCAAGWRRGPRGGARRSSPSCGPRTCEAVTAEGARRPLEDQSAGPFGGKVRSVQWAASCCVGPPGVASRSAPLAASVSL